MSPASTNARSAGPCSRTRLRRTSIPRSSGPLAIIGTVPKLAPLQQRKRQADDAIRAAFDACERACQQERDLLRQLEDLAANERAMYELDYAKDQTMTVLKLALVNLVMWTRDRYFPATYAQATWHRLAPFFRLPGRIVWSRGTVQVELRPFNDPRLTRDLARLCQRVEAARPR